MPFRSYLISFLILFSTPLAHSQCDTSYHQSDLVHYTSDIMGGVHYVEGTFHVKPNATIFVESYANDSCGRLEVHAERIIVEGTIDGNYAGYPGGAGGGGGILVNSLTGDTAALSSCSNKDQTGRISVEGGWGAQMGMGPGGGLAGTNGSEGAGPKQDCQNTNDEAGVIGSGAGGGGGAGGSYGGLGNAGGAGGDGSDSIVDTAVTVSSAYQVIAGTGGSGGSPSSSYGDPVADTIFPGSGGAGAGGGGRSHDLGLTGGSGGAGGGAVHLIASDSMSITGTVSVNGEDGGNGGAASHGNKSPKCCGDACDDCGELTLSCGAGSGGGAGGGSGGGILIRAEGGFYLTGTLSAKGGDGGGAGLKGDGITCFYNAGVGCGSDQTLSSGDGERGEKGGGGSGGRIKVRYLQGPNSHVNPSIDRRGGSGPNDSAAQGTYSTVDITSLQTRSEREPRFRIHPNPVRDRLNWSFSKDIRRGELVLKDLRGRSVFRKSLNEGRVGSLSLAHLEKGPYLLRVRSGERVWTRKLIVR